MIEFKPVFDRDGSVLLFDIFIDGKWIGSRRTMEQAQAAAEWHANAN